MDEMGPTQEESNERRCWYCSAVVSGGDEVACPSCGRTAEHQAAWAKVPRTVPEAREEGESAYGGFALALAIVSLVCLACGCNMNFFGVVVLGWGVIPAIGSLVIAKKTGDAQKDGMLRATNMVATVGVILNVIFFVIGLAFSLGALVNP